MKKFFKLLVISYKKIQMSSVVVIGRPMWVNLDNVLGVAEGGYLLTGDGIEFNIGSCREGDEWGLLMDVINGVGAGGLEKNNCENLQNKIDAERWKKYIRIQINLNEGMGLNRTEEVINTWIDNFVIR